MSSSSSSHQGHAGSPPPPRGWLRRLAESISGEPRDLDQLAEVLADARERGLIDADVLEMLESVLEVSEIQVRDVMVPRSQMVVINRDDPVEKILPVVIESGHSRFPVVGEDRDEVAGILLAKDLLRFFVEENRDNFDIRECLRPAVFIPESKRLNVLLKEFRLTHNHMAIVVDEYGGVSGLLTIEDVLEQIVGDIGDEYDVDEAEGIRREADRTWTVPALTRVDEFNEAFGTRFSDEEADTIGGLVLHELGRMPRRGEAVQIGGIELKVTRADRRRIETLRVTTPDGRIAAEGS
jgi:magnesium and cobalt transporter